jgi:phage baseplate assembly protein W
MKAFRFINAGFDGAGAGGLGLTATGGLAMTDGDETVRQALFLLLSTTPGERVMRPGYGSRLHRLVFAPNDDTTAGLAIHYVRQAITRWEPRVEIIDVDAHSDPDAPWRLLIRLDYRVRASLGLATMHFSVDLDPYAAAPGEGRETSAPDDSPAEGDPR